MKKVFLLVSSLCTIIAVSSCKVTEVVKGPVVPADSVVKVEINPSVFTMTVGQQQQFTVVARNMVNAEVSGKPVTWISDHPTRATVSANGVVTAVSNGTAVIRATVSGVTGQALIAVTEVPINVIILTPSSSTLFIGQTITPTIELRGPNNQLLTNRFVEWTSTNTTVATVSPLGVITAVTPGVATIRATSEGKTANFTLTVTTIPAARLELSVDSDVQVGRTKSVILKIFDSQNKQLTTLGRNILWSSSNTSVATVLKGTEDHIGRITGLSTGTTTVVAVVDNKVVSINLSVDVVQIDTILIVPSDTISMISGTTRQLTTQAFDSDGILLDQTSLAGRTFFWVSETPNIIAVSNTGLVTAVSAGEGTIRVSLNNKVTRRKIKVIP